MFLLASPHCTHSSLQQVGADAFDAIVIRHLDRGSIVDARFGPKVPITVTPCQKGYGVIIDRLADTSKRQTDLEPKSSPCQDTLQKSGTAHRLKRRLGHSLHSKSPVFPSNGDDAVTCPFCLKITPILGSPSRVVESSCPKMIML